MSVNTQLNYQEYDEKTSIKNKLDDYYRAQTTKNGLESLEKILRYLPKKYSNYRLERGIAFAHLGMESILERVAEGKEFAVVSGLNPSAPLHLGHKALFDLLISLQKIGGRIFIPITNDESVMDGKAENLTASRKMAYEEIIPSIIAFGFDPQKTHIFVDSDYPDIYNLAMHLGQSITMSELTKAFGKESLTTPGQVFYRGAVQLAQILLPQLPEFGGSQPTLIPVGIDQHPYLLLARDISKKLKMNLPSELVIKFQPSLKDPEAKMSGSKPETAIYLSDTPELVRKKINKAYTGAVSSLAVHQEKGGVPDICSVFNLLTFHQPDSVMIEALKSRYISGDLTMKELKEIVIEFIIQLLDEHKARRSNVSNMDQFLLSTPLRSFLGKEY